MGNALFSKTGQGSFGKDDHGVLMNNLQRFVIILAYFGFNLVSRVESHIPCKGMSRFSQLAHSYPLLVALG